MLPATSGCALVPRRASCSWWLPPWHMPPGVPPQDEHCSFTRVTLPSSCRLTGGPQASSLHARPLLQRCLVHSLGLDCPSLPSSAIFAYLLIYLTSCVGPDFTVQAGHLRPCSLHLTGTVPSTTHLLPVVQYTCQLGCSLPRPMGGIGTGMPVATPSYNSSALLGHSSPEESPSMLRPH